ncbi:MAG TPA: penicillin-binding transpeptidase domain-containing protein [Aeromicrobium sp.]|nr:penicillin-binding transpeptidase domain-containing protein [Aeromicrobium sp.]
MNRPIRALAAACLVMFLALLVNVNYVQFVQADSLNSKNGNKRVVNEEFSRDRGPILVGGEPVAESVRSDDAYKYQRVYSDGKLYAPVTGYFSYIYGRGGLEYSENSVLSGSDNRLFVSRVVDVLANKQPKGGSIETTLDPLAQEAAAAGLARLGPTTRGAAVAIRPSTGEVLAMVSQPSYDPSTLASHHFGSVERAWTKLLNSKTQPLLNRATQQTLPPGSTFKLVTAAAALEKLGLQPDDMVQAGSRLSFPGVTYTLGNHDGGNCGGDRITFEHALEVSCNVAFGGLAGQIGAGALADQARAFGFGTDPLEGLPSSPSRFPTGHMEPPQVAQAGIGQYDVSASPLQMAMVAAAVANGGEVMRPFVVKAVRAPNLRVLDETEPESLGRAMSSANAGKLTQMMVSTVTRGTAASARIPGMDVAGKTGTAQSTKDRPPYAWFVSFAPADNPQVAVAVVVESSNTARSEIAGGRLAGPVARAVMQAVLGQ